MSNLVHLGGMSVDYKDSFKYFLRFLKNNNAYFPFIKEWFRINGKNRRTDHIVIATDDAKLYLGHAFCWAYSTSKTREYWVKLNRKWIIKECGVSLYSYNKMGYEPKINSCDD